MWKNTLIQNVEPFNYTKYGLINKRLQPLHEGRLRCASYFWAVFQNQNDISDICSRLLPPFSPHLLLWGVIRIRIRVLQWLESSFLLMSARFLVKNWTPDPAGSETGLEISETNDSFHLNLNHNHNHMTSIHHNHAQHHKQNSWNENQHTHNHNQNNHHSRNEISHLHE